MDAFVNPETLDGNNQVSFAVAREDKPVTTHDFN